MVRTYCASTRIAILINRSSGSLEQIVSLIFGHHFRNPQYSSSSLGRLLSVLPLTPTNIYTSHRSLGILASHSLSPSQAHPLLRWRSRFRACSSSIFVAATSISTAPTWQSGLQTGTASMPSPLYLTSSSSRPGLARASRHPKTRNIT